MTTSLYQKDLYAFEENVDKHQCQRSIIHIQGSTMLDIAASVPQLLLRRISKIDDLYRSKMVGNSTLDQLLVP